MDTLTALIYETYDKDKSELALNILAFFFEHGEHLVHKSDSTGNRMIHNICMALNDSD